MTLSKKEWTYMLAILVLTCYTLQAIKTSEKRIYVTEASITYQLVAMQAMFSTACGMEYYARYYHRQHWHNKESILFDIHQTHHLGKSIHTYWEKNDILGILNFFIVIVPLNWSIQQKLTFGSAALLGLCIGISVFGTSYMIIHDGVCHHRFPVFGLSRIPFIQNIAKAHAEHHTSNQGAPYGLFLGPQELEAYASGYQPSPMPWYIKYSLVLSVSIATFGILLDL